MEDTRLPKCAMFGDKGTIATALSNARAIEEALEAGFPDRIALRRTSIKGLELLLPECAGTAVPTPLGLNPKVKKHSGGTGCGSASANALAGRGRERPRVGRRGPTCPPRRA